MAFQIIGDSSLDMNDDLDAIFEARTAPFNIEVGGKSYRDDESLDYMDLLMSIGGSQAAAKTSAPSPYDFINQVHEDTDCLFIITISSMLSGSHNSAMIARNILRESRPGIKVHVVDSKSASVGETHLAYEIDRQVKSGGTFESIVDFIEAERDESELFFLLDNLDTLIKNGRMSVLTGMLASFLHIKPILKRTVEGQITLAEKTRTYSKALDKLADLIAATARDVSDKTLMISHCRAFERATALKEKVLAKRKFSEVHIVAMKGLSSTYANVGGLICSL
jgi:DegV family protein with EDD domain